MTYVVFAISFSDCNRLLYHNSVVILLELSHGVEFNLTNALQLSQLLQVLLVSTIVVKNPN